MAKETRTERIKRKDRALKNAGLSVKEANKAKFWSDEKILKELGVKIPKSLPKLRKRPKDPKKLKAWNNRKKRQRNNIIYAISIGLSAKEASKAKSYARRKIKSTKQYKDTTKDGVKISKFKKPKSQKARIKLWEEWSKADSLPPEIHEIAREVNRNTYIKTRRKYRRLDDTDKYGYMVAFYHYTLGMDIEEVKERNPVDRYDGNRYVDTIAEMT